MPPRGRTIWYFIAGLWALFLGTVAVNGLAGVSGDVGVEEYTSGSEPQEIQDDDPSVIFEGASCLISLVSSVFFLLFPVLMIVLIIFLARKKFDSMKYNEGRRPRIISSPYEDKDTDPGPRGRIHLWRYPDSGGDARTVKYIHGDADRLMEMISRRGTGIPMKCPGCGGPVTSMDDGKGICSYCGTEVDFETIRNGIMRLLE